MRLNNPDGTIKYGTQDVPLFKPPINLVKRNPSDLVKQTVKLTVALPMETPLPQKAMPSLRQEPVRQQPATPQRGPDIPRIPEQQKQEILPQPRLAQQQTTYQEPSEQAFILNEKRQYEESFFSEGQGVDFYIDGARFLPENVTYSRVLMRVLTIDQQRVIGTVKSGAHLDISTNWNPFYGFRFEIRGSPQIDPTAVVQATVEAIDRSDG